MRKLTWREPTTAERSVADDWIAAWNLATGDEATLPDDLQAVSSCSCGTCPTFALGPVELRDPERQARPLRNEGGVRAADGSPLAGLIAFWDDSVLEIEVYPSADDVVRLEDVTGVVDAPGSAK